MMAHRFNGAIYWSTTPPDMRVRVGGTMVHRVVLLTGGDRCEEIFNFECGAQALRDEVTETRDPVDCMACMIQRTTVAMEAEFAEYEEAYP